MTHYGWWLLRGSSLWRLSWRAALMGIWLPTIQGRGLNRRDSYRVWTKMTLETLNTSYFLLLPCLSQSRGHLWNCKQHFFLANKIQLTLCETSWREIYTIWPSFVFPHSLKQAALPRQILQRRFQVKVKIQQLSGSTIRDVSAHWLANECVEACWSFWVDVGERGGEKKSVFGWPSGKKAFFLGESLRSCFLFCSGITPTLLHLARARNVM